MKIVLDDGTEVPFSSVKSIEINPTDKVIISLNIDKTKSSYETKKILELIRNKFTAYLGVEPLVIEETISSISKIEYKKEEIKETITLDKKEEVVVVKKEESKEKASPEKKEEKNEVLDYLDKLVTGNFKKIMEELSKKENSSTISTSKKEEKEDKEDDNESDDDSDDTKK